jgi:hypothetical protein
MKGGVPPKRVIGKTIGDYLDKLRCSSLDHLTSNYNTATDLNLVDIRVEYLLSSERKCHKSTSSRNTHDSLLLFVGKNIFFIIPKLFFIYFFYFIYS